MTKSVKANSIIDGNHQNCIISNMHYLEKKSPTGERAGLQAQSMPRKCLHIVPHRVYKTPLIFC